MAEPTEELLLALLGRFKDRLPVEDIAHVREMAEHREWGIGFEDLCTQLHEHSIALETGDIVAIKQLASEMDLSSDTWSFLEARREPSFFTVMALVEKRPGMYVGYSNSQRDEQLRGLDMLIAGYALAVHFHGLRDPGFEAYAGFGDYLRGRFGWSMSCGPIAAIREASDSGDDAWARFWQLLAEFRASLEAGTRVDGAG